jgi:hypothetical protein
LMLLLDAIYVVFAWTVFCSQKKYVYENGCGQSKLIFWPQVSSACLHSSQFSKWKTKTKFSLEHSTVSINRPNMSSLSYCVAMLCATCLMCRSGLSTCRSREVGPWNGGKVQPNFLRGCFYAMAWDILPSFLARLNIFKSIMEKKADVFFSNTKCEYGN